jgi:hypothetical protein
VTQQPWAGKPYRVSIYAGDKSVGDYEGLTDAEGHTLTLRFPQPVADKDVAARPVIGSGGFKAFFKLVGRGSETMKGLVYFFSFGGRVFVGMSDDLGNTAEVLSKDPGAVETRIYGREADMPPTWREDAAILNRTIEAQTPEERIALLDQAMANDQARAGDKSSLVKKVGMSLLQAKLANALLARSALPEVEKQLVQAIADRASGKKGTEWAEDHRHLNGMVEVLKQEQQGGIAIDPQSSLMQQAIDMAQKLPKAEQRDSALSLLFIMRVLLDAREFDLAEKITRANALDEYFIASTDNLDDTAQSQLAMQSELALARGDSDRAQTWFSLANVIQAMGQVEKNKKHSGGDQSDKLAYLRARFPGIGLKDMQVSDRAIAALRKQCVASPGERDMPVFIVGDAAVIQKMKNDEDDGDGGAGMGEMAYSIRSWGTMLVLNAMLVHGTLKPGSYTRSISCDGAAAKSVMVSESDLKWMRSLSMLGTMLMLDDKNIPKEAMPDGAAPPAPHLADVLAVFLQHAQLKPGIYQMDKLLHPVELKIGF